MACHAIYYDDAVKGGSADDYLYVTGVDEPKSQDRDGTIHGFLNAYERRRDHPDWVMQIMPEEINGNPNDATTKAPVRYPVAMTTKMNGNEPEIVVVSVSSDDSFFTDEIGRAHV